MQVLIFFCFLIISISACGPHSTPHPPELGSSLAGIQDQKYQLKLEEVAGTSGTYEFKTCVSNTPHCVAAFQGLGGEAITFKLETLTHRALTKSEKTRLLRLQNQWHSYQTQLNMQKGLQIGGAVASGAVVMGGAGKVIRAGDAYLTAGKEYSLLKTDFDLYRSLEKK